jgi:hypothetical protein
MTIKGKGNYTGTIAVGYSISETSIANANTGASNLKVTPAQVVFSEKKSDSFIYQPTVKVTDGKQTLKKGKDYTITYVNCEQTKVKTYLQTLRAGGTVTDSMKPKAEIKSVTNSGYADSYTIGLTIYDKKLTAANLYILVSGDTGYTGSQITPTVTVYYGDKAAVKAAKEGGVTDESTLTNQTGSYKLTKLVQQTEAGAGTGYMVSYGANVSSGKNKGTVTVTGTGLYGGSVTVKFDIQQKGVN